ncbi:TOMM precursor leader peptide-binding protein [Streptomyces sp. NTH33]|uniref:TOMM precursor leader peptide-binding protein n=1 Tax=Streptomyces sp. NTH33 TaxID=1735453 RepID=UPI0015E895A0|nr:TOMM precursor leader peptide-binding protein [Streptomyces sp. NTH33]
MHADDRTPQELFAGFRDSRVLVTGPPSDTAAAVVRGLLRNGLAEVTLDTSVWQADFDADLADLAGAGVSARVVALPGTPGDLSGYDVVVCVADSSNGAALLDLTRRIVGTAGEGGPRLLPVVTGPDRAVIGPVCGPAGQPCWVCAQLRLSANTDPRLSADLWQGLALGPVGPAAPAHGSAVVQGMIGNGVAFDVFRLRTGQLDADAEAYAVVQDLVTLESCRERVLPHPRCPMPHREAAPAGDHLAPPTLDSESYERAESLISPHLGMLSAWTDESVKQIPLKTGRVRLGAAWSLADGPREITAFDVDVLLLARARAALSAVSTYVGRLGPRRRADDVEPAVSALVPPDRLTVHSGVGPMDSHRPRTWLPAVSLHDGSTWYVPDAAVYPLSSANTSLEFEPTSSGAAAAWTVEAAQEQGLCSALAYRALTGAVRGTAPIRRLDETLLASDDEVRFALDSLRHIDRRARVFALPGAAPAFAVLAVVDGPGDTPPDWAVGSALSARAATRAAVLDAVGLAVTRHYEGAPADLGDPLLADFDPRVLTDDGTVRDWSFDESEVPVREALAALAADGTRALFADTTTIDLGPTRGMATGTVLLAAE